MTGAFAQAQAAIDAHDPDALRAILEATPAVVHETAGENANTLIGMATGTCDDRTVRLLLTAGADPDRGNAHGWTALHQAAYMNAVHLLDLLFDAGVSPAASARGDGGTPLVVAQFWGHATMADALVARGGVQPRNLRAAAGAGDVALIGALLGTPAAGARRGFYRPHTGFPVWVPSDDPQEVLDEALAYAARNGRLEAMAALVDAGAGLESDVYRGTPLIWAASCGRADAVRALLDLGADPNTRGTYGGPTHGEAITALHIAGEAGAEDVVRALLDAGADTSVVDGNGYGNPAGWARHNGHGAVADIIAGT